jgi:hypothetical protein
MDPSSLGKKGGRARAKALSPEQRSAIARNAAATRWSRDMDESIPKAVCGGDNPLRIGPVEIPCFVLNDKAESRVLTQRGLQQAIGMGEGGGAKRMTSFVASLGGNPSKINELAVRINAPIIFQPPTGGKPAHGYEATILSDLCKAVLEARREGRLNHQQHGIAQTCEVLLEGFAHVGIVALVDEATGYQYIRKRLALAEILDRYLDDRLNVWTKTFPDEFYEQLFRLKGWDYTQLKAGDIKPHEVGTFTKDEVYRRLHPGIVMELERNNPCVVPGRRQYKHHQWLTREVGHPALKQHVTVVIALMKVSKDWLHFMDNLQTAMPISMSDTAYFDFIRDHDGKREPPPPGKST